MKTRNLVLSLAAASLALGAGNLAADADQPYHVSGQFGSVNLDNDRDTRTNDVWWSVGFGRFFGNNFSLDLEYDQFSGTFRGTQAAAPGATYDQWKLSNTGLMGRYYFGQSKVRPYLAVGVGSQKHRSVLDEGRAISASFGLGLAGQLTKHFSARAQALYRTDWDDNSQFQQQRYNDLILSVGLNFDFGGKDAPPPPPPAAPVAPPPPPPNPDLDGDGVLNERDKCPNTRPGAVVDLDGCEVEAVIELEGIHFDFDKATLKPEAMVVLNEAAALLSKHDRVVVEVAGHTDSRGSESYNQGLSERRANAVKNYLTSKGVKASRLSARGYGESRPVASNDTDAGRAENRRVEMIILDR
ncbi:MAG: OmpA family protein [Xanthomonadales bacterium]|nr:OmpA family protein [Gammaproteobacteria bacterium]NND57762.1 OmpA family protein [Xanthomonadales bacterium]NNK51477.1 OmpA family protein [Xanthomonadales bacterium]